MSFVVSTQSNTHQKIHYLEPEEASLPPVSTEPYQLSRDDFRGDFAMIFDFSTPVPLPPSKAASGPKPGKPLPRKELGSTAPPVSFSLPKTNGHHPLPVKPIPLSRYSSNDSDRSSNSRGVKRGASPILDPAILRPAKRVFKWPTIESTHRIRIKGDGDVSIKGIAFSSDGSHFVVNC